MFRTFRIPLTWSALVSRTLKDISQDNMLGLAAQLAYYFLFALVPSILCLVAATSFLPSNTLQDLIGSLGRFAPQAILDILREQMTDASQSDGGLLTFGLLIAIWSSSAAMVGITDALNRAYDIEEGRPWWKVRLTAIALTVGVAVFVVVALVLVMIGPTLAEQVAAQIGLGPTFAMAWKIFQWPIAFALVTFAIGLIYYFAPDAEQDWEWVTPGAVLATVLWLITSLVFKIYVASFADYSTYGSLGGAMVLMLWFYLTALAILTGAEMNAEIDHASEHGKAPGEKVAGEKKKLGAAAARELEERQRIGGTATPGQRQSAAAGTAALQPARPSFPAYALLGIGLVKSFVKKRPTAARR